MINCAVVQLVFRSHLPSLDDSGSMSEESRRQEAEQQHRYYNDGGSREMTAEEEVMGPEIFIPQPEYFTRMPTSELR